MEVPPHTPCRLTHMLITADCIRSGIRCWTVSRMLTHILIITLQLQPQQKKKISAEHFCYCFSLLVHFSSRNYLDIQYIFCWLHIWNMFSVLLFFPSLVFFFHYIWTKGQRKASEMLSTSAARLTLILIWLLSFCAILCTISHSSPFSLTFWTSTNMTV